LLLIDKTERRTNKAPFLIAEVLEIISNNYPVRMKVWYYETYKRKGLIYGNGRFARMNNNDNSLDTGIESEISVVCKFKRLCKGGKIPKNVKNIITTNNDLDYSFDIERGNERESEEEFESSSSDESNESQETENQSTSSSEEKEEENENKSRELTEVFNSTVLNEKSNEGVISSGEKRKRAVSTQRKSLPKGWVYLSGGEEKEEKKKEEEENTRKTRHGRRY
jgi:hypothetical protein